jgi:hypothetical protein
MLFGVVRRNVVTSGDDQFFASQKVCKLLTPMLVMRKVVEGAKGKMICKA